MLDEKGSQLVGSGRMSSSGREFVWNHIELLLVRAEVTEFTALIAGGWVTSVPKDKNMGKQSLCEDVIKKKQQKKTYGVNIGHVANFI